MIHIGRAGAILGSFSEDEVRRGLATGRFFPADLGWKEGMENWAPLSQFSEFAAPPPPMPPLPGDMPVENAGVADSAEAAPHAGLPWDYRQERGWVMAFAETVRLILTNPLQAFMRMRVEGSLSSPLLYNLIGGWLGMLASGIYAVLITGTQPKEMSGAQVSLYLTPATAMAALKMSIWMGPIVATVFSLAASAIAHLFLMLTGGANKAFHVTLRVFCFSFGTTELLQMLPFCGGMLALVWLTVSCVVGLAGAHGTTTGRSVAAMLLFVAASFICGLGFLFLAASMNLDALRALPTR